MGEKDEAAPELPLIYRSPRAMLTAKDEAGVRTLLRWGLVMAVFFPVVGLVIGLVLLGKRARWGVGVVGLSLVVGVVYAAFVVGS